MPFEGEGFAEVCVRVITSPLLQLHEVNPQISETLSHVVSRCLEKERGYRYPDMGALIDALASAVS